MSQGNDANCSIMTSKREYKKYVSQNTEEEYEIEQTFEIQVIERNKDRLLDTVDPYTLCVGLDCLSKKEKKIIASEIHKFGDKRGLYSLLDQLVRHSGFWEDLLSTLRDEKEDKVCDILEKDLRIFKAAADVEDASSVLTSLVDDNESPNVAQTSLDEGQQSDEEVPRKIPKLAESSTETKACSEKQGDIGNLSGPSVDDDIINSKTDFNEKQKAKASTPDDTLATKPEIIKLEEKKTPRKYQIALAKPAQEGKNTIVCAPTGTGKTFVAALICQSHLEKLYPKTQRKSVAEGVSSEGKWEVIEKAPLESARIVVIVSKHTLMMQWYRELKKEFPLWKVGKKSGSSTRQRLPLALLMNLYDVMVVTAEIFKNAFMENIPTQITFPTLMILDECHHAMQNHPYNMIMAEYLKIKFEKPKEKLPQIVGLSATPAVAKRLTSEAALKRLLTLCGNLDTEIIPVLSEECQEELQKMTTDPVKKTTVLAKRVENPFSRRIHEMMKTIEEKIDWSFSDLARDEPKYSTALNELLDEARDNNCDKRMKCVEQLFKYHEALLLIDKARLKDGFDLLSKSHDELFKLHKLDETQKFLLQLFKDARDELNRYAEQEKDFPNNKLIALKKVLVDTFCKEAEVPSGILFVETKLLAEVLTQWIQDDEDLSMLNPHFLYSINTSKDSHVKSMTESEQMNILSDFKSGKVKLIISTSFLDEGEDMSRCSAVFSYCRSSNAITAMQSTGRIRTQEGVQHEIGEESQAERAEVNLLLIDYMTEAVQKLQKWQSDDWNRYREKLKEIQKQALQQQNSKKQKEISIKSTSQADNIEFQCRQCLTVCCRGSDIRVMDETSHINPDPAFRSKVQFRDHHNDKSKKEGIQKIHCQKCGADWGNTAADYPCLKLKQFKVLQEGRVLKIKKWKDLPCALQSFEDVQFSSNGVSVFSGSCVGSKTTFTLGTVKKLIQVMKYVCQILYQKSCFATGFVLTFAENKGKVYCLILTNEHVAQHIDKESYVLFNNHGKGKYSQIPAKYKIQDIVYRNKEFDIAIVCLEYCEIINEILQHTGLIKYGKNDDIENECRLYMAGHSMGHEMQFDMLDVVPWEKVTGIVREKHAKHLIGRNASTEMGINLDKLNFPDKFIFYECKSYHGSSGSPCFLFGDGESIELVCMQMGGIYAVKKNDPPGEACDFGIGIRLNKAIQPLELQWLQGWRFIPPGS